MATLSTHVLDTTLGRPAAGILVTLAKQAPDGLTFVEVGKALTDQDGRIAKGDRVMDTGIYRLTFDTGAYFQQFHKGGFYPQVPIVFEIRDPDGHYHVPLLVSPYGFSTYRGS